mgnify:CR=1 FL=1
MKRKGIAIFAAAAVLALAGVLWAMTAQEEGTPDNPEPSGQLDGYVKTFPAYAYAGETEASFKDRHFLLSAQPENDAEGLVAQAHYQAIAGDFDAMASNLAEETR